VASGLSLSIQRLSSGSLDYRLTPSNEVIQRGLTRGLPFIFDSGLTIAPVRDVAMGHILALRNGRNGERYILGGDRLSIPEYFNLIEKCCGRQRIRIRIPRLAMLGVGAAYSCAKLLGRTAIPFTFTQARHLAGKYGYYSSDKAFRELGYRWQTAQSAISDYIEWVRAGRPSSLHAV
jgi:dihydroflavonol-4-reductase